MKKVTADEQSDRAARARRLRKPHRSRCWLLARTNWICRPKAGTGFARPPRRTRCSKQIGRVHQHRQRAAVGTSSRRSSNRFAVNSVARKLKPVEVAAGPGEIGNQTKLTGSRTAKNDRYCRCRLLARTAVLSPAVTITATSLSHQLGCQGWQSVDLIVGPAKIDRHVLALDEAAIPQDPGERRADASDRMRRAISDRGTRSPATRPVERERSERPRGRAADET